MTKLNRKTKSMKHVGNDKRQQHKKISNILIHCSAITGRSRCWRKIQILSMTHMRENCHEQNTQNWEDENIH